jgi:hypothetical protein
LDHANLFGPLIPAGAVPQQQLSGSNSITIRPGVPQNSCTCKYGGKSFSVPPATDFSMVATSGKGHWFDRDAIRHDIGQWGTFDLQRNAANNEFIPAYTQAANFAVGAYMQGAEHGMLTMAVMGILYGMKNSNNFSFTQIGEWLEWWGMGWTAAEYGIYPSCQ